MKETHVHLFHMVPNMQKLALCQFAILFLHQAKYTMSSPFSLFAFPPSLLPPLPPP